MGNHFSVDKKVMAIDRALRSPGNSYKKCTLCARNCGVDRSSEERGFCGAGDQIKIYSYGPHHGEEPPISGKNGSGTIFFSNCCMGCVYCQNYQFSQAGRGRIISSSGLSEIIIELQNKGCHNINFVTPTHFAPGIMEALREAYIRGLNIPVVYNTGGFDSLDVIKSLDGVIDIYLPDMRYASNAMGRKYSNSPGYAVNNRLVIKDMFSQAGNLKMDGNGIAYRGLIIRLLVMPGGVSGTEETLEFIGRELGKDVYLSVMSQYYPAYQAKKDNIISRRVNRVEYEYMLNKIEQLGMDKGWIQPFDGDFEERFAGENFPPS